MEALYDVIACGSANRTLNSVWVSYLNFGEGASYGFEENGIPKNRETFPWLTPVTVALSSGIVGVEEFDSDCLL